MSAQLGRHFRPHEIEFFGRDRQTRGWPGKMYEYRELLTTDLVNRIFGKEGAFAFCSKDGSCAIEAGRWKRANCRRNPKENVACRRTRPDMLIFLCETNFYDVLFERFGRAALIITLDNETSSDEIAALIRSKMTSITKIKTYLANLSQSNYAPRLPFENFQNKSGHPVARDAQKLLDEFCKTMDEYHGFLYNSAFKNAKKPEIRGAYMFDDDIGFQRDRLHSTASVGAESRKDGYHLLNAFHMYGYAVSPGWHFDVSKDGGGEIRYSFRDVLTGKRSGPTAAHLNVTPDDRVIKAERKGGRSAFSEGG